MNVRDLPARFDAWREAGGTHGTVSTAGLGLGGVEGHIEYLAAAAAAKALALR